VLKRHEHVHVVAVGSPSKSYLREIQQRANELGVSEKILWTGFRKDIPQVMSALDLCLVPSRSEPFGLTAVEALAVGTPVIAARVGGLPETVDHERTGLLIPPGKSAALAEAINRLLTDTTLYAACQQAARPSMLERYDAERLWTRIEEILVDVGSRRKPVRRAA
jgi:glycosyltransferase involved in cell wall biosynthesis